MARINSSKMNNVLVKEILQAKVEALFQLKDRILSRDRKLCSRSGIKISVQQAIANTQTKSSICHHMLAKSYLEVSHQGTYY
eukprot:3839673-Ditylum_brightwellii.AAC.1